MKAFLRGGLFLLLALTTMKGTVKFYNIDKGFGFIKEEGADNEYHVHISGLKHQIAAGDTVTFDLQEGEKGKSAVNVMLEL